MGKYRNIKATVDGITFDSKKEANRYIQLRLLEKAGHISNLQLQVRYELIPKQKDERSAVYIADFVYNEAEKQLPKMSKDMRQMFTSLKENFSSIAILILNSGR